MYDRAARIIPHSPQFSLMSLSNLISMKIHLSTKALYGPYWTMSLSWSLAGTFLSTKPPNWLRHVRNRPHSFDTDTSREILQWFCRASQEEWSWFTEAAICSEHKRTMDTRQMQLGRKKRYSGHRAGLRKHWICTLAWMHKRKTKPGDRVELWGGGKGFRLQWSPDHTLNRMTDPELGLWGWRGGGEVRLQIRRWGSGGIKHAV